MCSTCSSHIRIVFFHVSFSCCQQSVERREDCLYLQDWLICLLFLVLFLSNFILTFFIDYFISVRLSHQILSYWEKPLAHLAPLRPTVRTSKTKRRIIRKVTSSVDGEPQPRLHKQPQPRKELGKESGKKSMSERDQQEGDEEGDGENFYTFVWILYDYFTRYFSVMILLCFCCASYMLMLMFYYAYIILPLYRQQLQQQ